jgi:hypothetical protein
VTIEVDGAVVPRPAASMPRKVNPGKHVVVAYADGYERATSEVAISERETRECELTLTPSKEAAGQRRAITVVPNNGSAPPPVSPALPIDDGAPSRGGTSPFVYLGGAIAGAGLLAGTIAGVAELGRTAEARASCEPGKDPDVCASALDTAHGLATFANVSLGVGVLGAATAIVALLLSSPSPARVTAVRTSLQLSVHPGAAGIAGTF